MIFKIDNLEYDLRTSDYIAEKCKEEYYAQNLYCAWCNMQWCPRDIFPALRQSDKDLWTASWRGAGGIVADLRNQGEDYMDYYCSGMGGFGNYDKDLGTYYEETQYVSEQTVTDEIREDLLRLGWVVVNSSNDFE